uniref:Uncharacterized protein n=1 Tax=viral metagenome TaxID=1070528 RepID=A0A6M3KJL7_9ZZZZ
MNISIDLGMIGPCALVLHYPSRNKVCREKGCGHKKRNGRCELAFITVPTTGDECWSKSPGDWGKTVVIEDDGYQD